ncbi:MAG: hypothetical protein AAF439_11135 [Pseudomonadota bacterium]
MSATAQEWLAGGAILFGFYLLLAQVPVFGTILKLLVRVAWVFAPLVIIAVAGTYLWYEGRAMIFGEPVATPVVLVEPTEPTERGAPDGVVPIPVPRPER